MTSDRLQQRLQEHFDAQLGRLEPPFGLIDRVLDIPLGYPVEQRGWLGLKPVSRRTAALVALVALAALATGAIALGWLRQPDPEPGPAAVALTTFGDVGMHVVGLDGVRDEKTLSDCNECGPVVLDVAWSPDGARLAYATGCAGMCAPSDTVFSGIWVRDMRSGESELLLAASGGDASDGMPLTAGVSALDWSADGSQIVYAARGGGLRLLDVETGQATPLSVVNLDGDAPITPLPVDGVSISPDGQMIAFSMRGGTIFVTRVDGSDTLALGDGSQPDWSPDGSLLAYRLGCELWTTSPDGAERTLVSTFPEATWGHASARSCDPQVRIIRTLGPVWSPDGSQLAAVFANRLYVLNSDGSDLEILQDPIVRGIGGVGVGVEWQPEMSP